MYDIACAILDYKCMGVKMQTYTINGCGDCSGVSESRRFLTKDEKIEMLKEYQQSLESETKGVKERIADLQKQKNEDEE